MLMKPLEYVTMNMLLTSVAVSKSSSQRRTSLENFIQTFNINTYQMSNNTVINVSSFLWGYWNENLTDVPPGLKNMNFMQ